MVDFASKADDLKHKGKDMQDKAKDKLNEMKHTDDTTESDKRPIDTQQAM